MRYKKYPHQIMVMLLLLAIFFGFTSFVFQGFVFDNAVLAAAESDQLAKVGDTVKPFRLKRLVQAKSESEYVNVEDYIGQNAANPAKVLLLGFYASWCAPCQKEFVHIQKMAKTYGKDGLAVLIIDVDDEETGIKRSTKFVKKRKPSFPVLSDKHHIVAGHFFGKSLNLPSIYLVTGDGVIRYVSHGGDTQTLKRLTRETRELLKSSTPVAKAASTQNDKGIMVWKLQANKGVDEADVNLISNFVTNQVAKYSGAKVISEADIHTILKGEESRQQCGAEDTSCVAEIGAALGVPEAVSGDIGKIGSYWMLNLRRINVRSAEVIGRSSRNIQGNVDRLIEVLPGAVAELFGKESPQPVTAAPLEKTKPEAKPAPPPEPGRLEVASDPPGAEVYLEGEAKGQTPYKDKVAAGEFRLELKLDGYKAAKQSVQVKSKETTTVSFTLERDYPMNPYKKYGYVTFFAGLGLAAFGGIATWQAQAASSDVQSGDWGGDSRAKAWSGMAVTGYVIGGAAMVTGVVLWALSPGDKERYESHASAASVSPTPDGKGAVVLIGGRW